MAIIRRRRVTWLGFYEDNGVKIQQEAKGEERRGEVDNTPAGTVVLWTVPSQYIRLHFKHLIPAGVAPNKRYTHGQLSIDYDVPIVQLVIY